MKLYKLMIPLLGLSIQHTAFADSSLFSIKEGDGFKRFAVSAGWLHVMPQGKPNNFTNKTVIPEGYEAGVGSIRLSDITENAVDKNGLTALLGLLDDTQITGGYLPDLGLKANVYGLEQWQSPNTGLEAQDVDTLGLVFNYFFTDHVSVELVGGIPPKVDLKGIGNVTAPLSTHTSVLGLADLDLQKDLQITNLDSYDKAASVRAWTPAATLQYHFGQTGVNKFRPYIGIGAMYAWFDDIKLNKGVEADLIAAGHQIQNVLDGKAGAALAGEKSSINPYVKVKADTGIAPFATAGFTYDFNDRWFSTASVSYAALNNKAKILVLSDKDQSELIRSETKVDINPVITYLGIGYRF
ncbi:OmpW/AlkL family protein [Alkanindiges illinoisensis]|uniref:OmpW family protein n=1 Tax=Alkanindiges illinoisensis TaxID=197183 RepID=A0A4Y7XG52_9GAMM|nr:OmpW family outer membrane protein [Alkanindiges illinoisensis]TEU30866.1 OmpW family protein [Alkanindiges illinoisensis]